MSVMLCVAASHRELGRQAGIKFSTPPDMDCCSRLCRSSLHGRTCVSRGKAVACRAPKTTDGRGARAERKGDSCVWGEEGRQGLAGTVDCYKIGRTVLRQGQACSSWLRRVLQCDCLHACCLQRGLP